jgi:dienelactone hydrolase
MALLAIVAARAAGANPGLTAEWPDPATLPQVVQENVTIASTSPYLFTDVGTERASATTVNGTLFLPPGPHAPHSLPAVVMLHGSGGVLASRELTYGKQLAAMGIAVLVVDSFGGRPERGNSYIERLLNITETMLVADGYAALGNLATRPEIDPKRVVLVGFSYGAMATMYALMTDVADRMAPPGLRYAGHVSFYGPCVARFEDHRTTGAPLLMLYGGDDQVIDHERCSAFADDLRAGGSKVDVVVYPGAGSMGWPVRAPPFGRNVSLRLRVARDGTVHDRGNGVVMRTGRRARSAEPVRHRLTLSDRRDDAVRRQSDRDFGRFLAPSSSSRRE